MYTVIEISSGNVIATDKDLKHSANAQAWASVADDLNRKGKLDELIFAYTSFNKLYLVFSSSEEFDITPYKFMLTSCIKTRFKALGVLMLAAGKRIEVQYSIVPLLEVDHVVHLLKSVAEFSLFVSNQLCNDLDTQNSFTGCCIDLSDAYTGYLRYNKHGFTAVLNEFLKIVGVAEYNPNRQYELGDLL